MGRSMYGLFQAHRYHLVLNWTELFQGILRGEAVAVKVFYRNWSEDFASPDSGMSTMSSTGSHSSFSSSPPSATSPEPNEYGNFQQVSEQLQLRRQDSMDCRNLKVGAWCMYIMGHFVYRGKAWCMCIMGLFVCWGKSMMHVYYGPLCVWGRSMMYMCVMGLFVCWGKSMMYMCVMGLFVCWGKSMMYVCYGPLWCWGKSMMYVYHGHLCVLGKKHDVCI